MKKICSLIGSFLIALQIGSPVFALDDSLTKQRVLSDLASIESMFEVKYAPKAWKQEFANWDLSAAMAEARNKIERNPQPTLKECQKIIRDFFNSTKDYHVSVKFYATESASLPFIVKGAQERYFVCYVESTAGLPFAVGDEILTFDGRAIHEVIEEIRVREYGTNTIETDRALAEMTLTNRYASSAHVIPSGAVEITGRRKGSNQHFSTLLHWNYTSEKIRDFATIIPKLQCRALLPAEQREAMQEEQDKGRFFKKLMMMPSWSLSQAGPQANGHTMGARRSFIPTLGRKVWSCESGSNFDAYIFETPSHKRVGYIRLPHYLGGPEEVVEWGVRMEFFQQWTDALIIDQVNNPGGSLFYLYALASTLSDKPLQTPKHRITLTQEEVYIAHMLLSQLENVYDDFAACEVLGDMIEGYPVDLAFAQIAKEFCKFIISQWEEGKHFSDPTYLFGFDTVKPHPRYHYRKPILLLTNCLDFSAGDICPAILQDNKVVTILGTRTAGAGGYLVDVRFPNQSGIKDFILTGSLVERIDSKPIENLGVRPDILYSLTAEDLQDNYRGYTSAILETVEAIIDKQVSSSI